MNKEEILRLKKDLERRKRCGRRGVGKTLREKILEILKEKEMTIPEMCEKLGKPYSQMWQNVRFLELEGKVERKRWFGAWVWGLKR